MAENDPNDFARGTIHDGGSNKDPNLEFDSRGRPVVSPLRPARREPKVSVTFEKPHGPYNSGETAGFDGATAARFVKQKLAYYTSHGHAPLNAALGSASSKADPAARAALAEGGAMQGHAKGSVLQAFNKMQLSASQDEASGEGETYAQLRARAQEKIQATGVTPDDFKKETLIAFLQD